MNVFKKFYNFIVKPELNLSTTYKEYQKNIDGASGAYEDPLIFFKDYLDHNKLHKYYLTNNEKYILDSFINNSNVIVCNSSTESTTFAYSLLIVWLLCTRQNYMAVSIAPNNIISQRLTETIKKILDSIKSDLITIEILEDTPQSVTLKNLDSTFIAKTITPTDIEGTFRGIDIDLLLVAKAHDIQLLEKFITHINERRKNLTYYDNFVHGTIISTNTGSVETETEKYIQKLKLEKNKYNSKVFKTLYINY